MKPNTVNSPVVLLLLFCSLLAATTACTQDTIYIYDVASATTSITFLNPYDTGITADSTDAFTGAFGNTAMPANYPADTFTGIPVSRPVKADSFYQNFNFPFNAQVKINYDMLDITAAVIGKRALLVYNYDVFYTNPLGWRYLGGMQPCMENGVIQYGFAPLTPVRYYALAPLTNRYSFAVVEVAENIGDYTGYYGLAFDTAYSAYNGQLLYNLSYPQAGHPDYYPTWLNGDTQYLRYGRCSAQSPTNFDFGNGENGEFVSPFFNDRYRIYGTRWNFAQNEKMTAKNFYFLKQVLNNMATGVDNVTVMKADVFPNPAASSFVLQLNNTPDHATRFVLYDAMGRQVKNESIVAETTVLYRNNLPSGVYFWQLQSENKIVGSGKVVME